MTTLTSQFKTIPHAPPTTGLRALRAILRERSVLPAMQVFHAELGDVFRMQMPGFAPVVMVGPQACHFVLVEARDALHWRIPRQPIVRLLERGVLVEDGDLHDQMRRKLNPALHKQMTAQYVEAMVARTDQVTAGWAADTPVDLLVEVRRMALLILMDTLFAVDYTPQMARLWDAVLVLMGYISPGLWLIWNSVPRPGYARARAQVDAYFFALIAQRRAEIARDPDTPRTDMLSALILSDLDDQLIRDQMMTMLTAGHDTATAALAWVFHLLGQHPDTLTQVQAEVDTVLAGTPPDAASIWRLTYLGQVIDEALRLYPPAHLGGRTAARELEFDGYHLPAGTRVLYSIFLTQRHPAYWDDPHAFNPERFAPGVKRQPYTYLPFGGGARACIGMQYAQVEMRAVLARVLQGYTLRSLERPVHLHMGATIEPRPGVWMQMARRF